MTIWKEASAPGPLLDTNDFGKFIEYSALAIVTGYDPTLQKRFSDVSIV